jgi:hypothetical protein
MKKRKMFHPLTKLLAVTDATDLLSYREWCKLNGRRWRRYRDVEEMRRNHRDHEAYLVAADPVLAETIRLRKENADGGC